MKRNMKPSHPGAILREDILKEMNITITAAALGLGISRKTLSEVVNENASVTAEMAVRLEHGFGVAAQFWLDLQSKYDLWHVHNSGRVAHIDRIKPNRAV
jgi:addiction module HigA family antidote